MEKTAHDLTHIVTDHEKRITALEKKKPPVKREVND